jgi:NTP pyrophosphatase (non-canonical NTP hydrolase)
MPNQKAWNEIAEEICRVNDANGWDRPTFDTLLNKLMLTVTELNEAADAVGNIYKEGTRINKDPLNEELADVAVRLLHMLESVWSGKWTKREAFRDVNLNIYQPIQCLLWSVLKQCCNAAEYWRDNNFTDVMICLEFALRETDWLARSCGYDLFAEVVEKTKKNANRGKFHGRARSDG